MISDLKPMDHHRVYDLVEQAGVDVSDWSNYKRAKSPASNPKYCYNWSFQGTDCVVLCLWFVEMQSAGGTIFQDQDYRGIASSPRKWNRAQRDRAKDMDLAIQLALKRRLPIRVIVVDGSLRTDADDKTRSSVERRLLDPIPWHVGSYHIDGECRLVRGPWPSSLEVFTEDEVVAAGTFREGGQSEMTKKTRERSERLRNLAREHFAEKSPDGRLHCAACDWVPPATLPLNSPIVEIHHGLGISEYPTDGRELTFEEAIKHLTPLCPNCHRIVHARFGGGAFSLPELRDSQGPANSQ